MMAACSILFLVILAWLNYRVARSILYPPFVFCIMWLLVAILYTSHLITIDRVHVNTFGFILAGAMLFTLGGRVASLVPRRLVGLRVRFLPRRAEKQTHFVQSLFLLFLIVNATLLFFHLLALAGAGTGYTFFQRARSAALNAAIQESESATGSLSYLSLAPAWSIFTALLFRLERRDGYFWVALLLSAISCVLTTGRNGLLILLASIAAAELLMLDALTISKSIRLLKWPVASFVVLFILMAIKGGSDNASGGLVAALAFAVISYIIGPTAALDQVIRFPVDFATRENHTFKVVFKIAALFHLISYTPPPIFDTFSYVPFPTNVYTVYKFYITDFGIVGALFVITLIGFLHCALYRRARTQNHLAMYLFSLSMYCCVMVFFDDAYSSVGFFLDASLFYGIYMSARNWGTLLIPKVLRRHNPLKDSLVGCTLEQTTSFRQG